MRLHLLALAVLPLLASCGDLPQPFRGNPGDAARRLAASPPVPPRLIVPAPGTALLSDDGSKALAVLLARDLQMREVPAYAEAGSPSDWVLAVTARYQGEAIVPVYTVRTPQGRDAGSLQGTPVPIAAWATGTLPMLEQVAGDAAPRLTAMLTGLNTSLQKADPNSLLNRSARVAVPDVTGAPGDGNTALTRLMRAHLSGLGEAVQTDPKDADFVVQGRVRVVAIGGGQERVEIQWIVSSPTAGERGRVVQLNDVPAGSLAHAWADVAEAVTEQASGGVRDVVLRQSGREPAGQKTAGQPPSPAATAGVMDSSPNRR